MRFRSSFAVTMLMASAHAFLFPKFFTSPKSLLIRKVVVDRPSAVTSAEDSWPKFPKPFGDTERLTPLREIITEPVMDTISIGKDFAYQGLVLNLSFLLAMIFDVDMMHYATSTSFFHIPSLIQSGLVLFIILGATLVADRAPVTLKMKHQQRDAKIAALQTFGLSSPLSTAAVVGLLSIVAGLAQELVFRGFLFTILDNMYGPVISLLVSSVAYGISHFPVFSSNVVKETLLGVAYGLAFFMSGYNIMIPVFIHVMYEFISTFFTWLFAAKDLNERIDKEQKLLEKEVGSTGNIEESTMRAIYKLLDVDGDNGIDINEWSLALRLFGFGGNAPVATEAMVGTNYEMFYRLSQQQKELGTSGKISYNQFATALRETTKFWKERDNSNKSKEKSGGDAFIAGTY